MKCTDCDFETNLWFGMRSHYKLKHPDVKAPYGLFTKEARSK